MKLWSVYFMAGHILKSYNIYLKPERFRKSKFILSKVTFDNVNFAFDNENFDLRIRSGFK